MKIILPLILMTRVLVAQDTKVTDVAKRALPDFPGKEVLMITVDYAPGATGQPHRHNADTFVYVLEGSIVMGVQGGQSVTLTPGQMFYESPSDIHTVGRNASKTKPAKFLVFMLKDKGAAVSVPVK